MHPASPWRTYAITRFDDVAAAFLDTQTFSPEATQELHTFPFMGEQMLGFEGRKHTEFGSDSQRARIRSIRSSRTRR